MNATAAPITLRPMTTADIPRVIEIERQSFPTTWPVTAYKQELEQNQLARYILAVMPDTAAASPSPARGLRARLRRLLHRGQSVPAPAERIAGYLGLWYMIDEAHIVAVATDPALRRRGIGELLVAEALELARARDAQTVTLEVRVSNTAAQALYEKYGFRRLGLRKRYYTDNNEDALIMTTPELSDPAYQARLAGLRRARERRAQEGDRNGVHVPAR